LLRRFLIAAGLAAVFLCAQPTKTLAQGQQAAIEQCFSGAIAPALRVAACTSLLEDNTASEITRGGFYALRGLGYLELGDARRAIADYDRAIAIRPDVGLAYRARGLAHVKLNNLSRAIADLNQAIKLEPNDAKHFHVRGLTHFDAGEFDRAIADLDHSVSLAPNNAEFRIAPCFLRAMTGRQLDRAERDCQAAVRLDASESRAFSARGLLNMKYGRFKAALADYDQAMKLEVDKAEYLYGRGMARQRLDDRSGSDDKARARSLDPDIDARFVRYGFTPFDIPETVWRQADERCRAIGTVDTAMIIASCTMLIDAGFLDRPAQATVLAWRADFHARLNQLETAIADLSRSLELEPLVTDRWIQRGLIRLVRRDSRDALSDYEEALRQNPKDGLALFGRGLARLQLGDRAGYADIDAARRLTPTAESYFNSNGLRP
jgi:tetratricopeptide (TPR) repeat protein